METTIYQAFVSRYATTFTYVEHFDGKEYAGEMIPAAIVAKLDEDEFTDLLCEVRSSENEKASWGECEYEDEEDLRTSYHQTWDEIDRSLDDMGL